MNTFISYLKKRTKKELIHIAKLHHMPRYSSLCKEELANQLGSYLLSPSVMEHFFVYLGSDELNTFLYPDIPFHPVLFKRLYEGGYCFKEKNNTYFFSEDLSLHPFFNDAFWKKQKQKSFFIDCLDAAGILYGCAPISILLKMYNTYAEQPMTQEQFIFQLKHLPDYFNHFILKKDLYIHSSLYENDLYKKIQLCQGTLPFYLPKKEEIIYLSRYGYFPEDIHMKKLTSCLQNYSNIPASKLQEISGKIQSIFRQGGTIADGLHYLSENYYLTINPFSDKHLLSALNEVFSHTKLLLNRGYTAAEVLQLKKKKIKIYPNSPCPCGSGKKYKNCCSRR